ncbi:Golgi apparatus membrane protein TVP23-like protein [Aphelenchoides besseyi]|nr:Golgi apparatus membrane protein TVP23-like protein [Aphelenchoides besseyi]
MFRSAASQVGSTSSLNSTRSSSAYQSFQSVFKETARTSNKRPIEESSDSSDDDVRIMEQIDYNSKFTRELKKRKLEMDSNLPLTTSHDPHELKMKFYSTGEQSMNWRYFSLSNIEKLKKGATERVFRPYQEIKTEIDFIPLSKGPFKPEEEDDAQIYAEYSESMSMEDYKLMKDRRWADPDAMSMEQKQKLVKKDVNDNKRNVYQWLHFLKFEEEYFAYENQLNGRSRDSGRMSYLERRAEIIKSGLKSVHRDEAVELKLEMMKTLIERFGSHHEIVEKEWKKVQIDYVNSEPMWKAYIADRIHRLSGFNIVNAEKPYAHAIERLNNLLNGTLVSHKVLDGTEDFLIDLVVARCKLFLEAGYVSHVIGNLQAIAEFMFFISAQTKQQRHSYQIQEFKEFWESGMPRIGDADAKGELNNDYKRFQVLGWKNTVYDRNELNKANEKKILSEEKLTIQIEDDEIKMPELFTQAINYTLSAIWSEIEKKRSERCWPPVTPISEFNDKERFQYIDERIVKFESVKPSLIQLSSPTNALRLIFRILQLFGVKVPGMIDTTQQGVIEEILPGDFDHLRPKYHGIRDFFIDFLTKLATTTESIEIGYVLSTIVSSAIYFLNVEDIDEDQKTNFLNRLQKQIYEWPAVGKDISHRFFCATESSRYSDQKRMFALAFFGAKIQIYKKAQENDDTLWSRTVSKQIKEILEEAVPMLSESFVPESLIWRIWFYIHSELQHRTEIDKLYTLGVRSCPYSKHFLLDVTKSPFTSTGRLKEIIDLADKHKLCIFTVFKEAEYTNEAIDRDRKLGLRWWNIVDSEGKNHWKFESAKDPTRFDATERYIFWMGLIIAPALWILFVATAFLTFKWEWMVIAILGSGMSLANLYGYLRCKWNNTTEMTNYFTKLAFLSFLTRPSVPQQQPGPTATV